MLLRSYNLSIDHIIGGSKTKDDSGKLERFIVFTLLNYGHQFIGSLHAIVSKS